MIPVFQEKICNKTGDCFPACISSILEIPLCEVPKLDPEDSTHSEFVNGVFLGGQEVSITKWLAAKGYVILQLSKTDGNFRFDWGRFSILEPYVICSVPSQKFEGSSHAVVGQFKINQEEHYVQLVQAHDPNKNNQPYKNFYDKVSFISILIKVK